MIFVPLRQKNNPSLYACMCVGVCRGVWVGKVSGYVCGCMYVCVYGYAFRRALRNRSENLCGGRGLRAYFEVTSPQVKGHPEVKLP